MLDRRSQLEEHALKSTISHDLLFLLRSQIGSRTKKEISTTYGFSLRTELVNTKSHGVLQAVGSHGDGLGQS